MPPRGAGKKVKCIKQVKGKGNASKKVTVLENTESAFRSVILAAIIRFKHQVIRILMSASLLHAGIETDGDGDQSQRQEGRQERKQGPH
jgi:hypothetical protein